MIKSVLFDFDGVLTTDSTGSVSICRYISSAMGIDFELLYEEYHKYNKQLLCGEKTHKEIWQELCLNVGVNIPESVLKASFENTPIDNLMINLISELKAKGFKVGIITDNKKDRMDCIADKYGWKRLFDVIVISSEIGSGKNEEMIFEKALEKLNLSACECIFIDNQKKNLIIPQNMGFHTVYYNHEIRNFEELVKILSEKIGMSENIV